MAKISGNSAAHLRRARRHIISRFIRDWSGEPACFRVRTLRRFAGRLLQEKMRDNATIGSFTNYPAPALGFSRSVARNKRANVVMVSEGELSEAFSDWDDYLHAFGACPDNPYVEV